MTNQRKHKTVPKPGDIVESAHRPPAFVPDPTNISVPKQVGPQAVDLTGYEGEWYKQDEPPGSDPYGKKMYPDDPYGQTVHMKNQDHYWGGTPEQFKMLFAQQPPETQQLPSPPSEPPAV